jgi:hypothetical protein
MKVTREGRLDLLQELLAAGVEVNLHNLDNYFTALDFASTLTAVIDQAQAFYLNWDGTLLW